VSRDVLIVACAVSAGVHAALVPDHLAFLPAAAVLAVLAAVIARGSSGVSLDIAIVVLSGLIVAYLLAVTSGIPLLHPAPDQVSALGVATKAIETAGILAALDLKGVVAVSDRTRPGQVPLALIALIACFSALAALAVSGPHMAHTHGDHATSGLRGR
jgi:hypothetical protein